MTCSCVPCSCENKLTEHRKAATVSEETSVTHSDFWCGLLVALLPQHFVFKQAFLDCVCLLTVSSSCQIVKNSFLCQSSPCGRKPVFPVYAVLHYNVQRAHAHMSNVQSYFRKIRLGWLRVLWTHLRARLMFCLPLMVGAKSFPGFDFKWNSILC